MDGVVVLLLVYYAIAMGLAVAWLVAYGVRALVPYNKAVNAVFFELRPLFPFPLILMWVITIVIDGPSWSNGVAFLAVLVVWWRSLKIEDWR